jgi:hypothetical protein
VRITFLLVLSLCGVFSSAAVAAGIDPVGTVTGAVSTIASQTTVVSGLTDQTAPITSQTAPITSQTSATSAASATAAGLVGTATSVTDGGTAGGTASSASTSDSGGQQSSRSDRNDASRSSRHASPRTRFDRLPRRYEILLERIESGRNVHASIVRLRALLADATPRMRARILHLIRREIRRLERNGLTQRERGAVRRLRRLLVAFAPQPSPATAVSPRAVLPLTHMESTPADRGAGVASKEASGRQSQSDGGGPTLHIPGVALPAPPPPSEWFKWLLMFLQVLAIAAVAAALLRTAVQFAARFPSHRR